MKLFFKRVAKLILAAGILAASPSHLAAANPGVIWGDPVRLSDPTVEAGQPAMAVDAAGMLHVVWSQSEITGLDRPPGEGDTIYYSSFNGEVWSRPIDVVVGTTGRSAQFPELTATPNGYLHMLYSTGGTTSALMYTSVHVWNTRDIYAWSKPVMIASPVQGQHTFVSDKRGYLYAAYADVVTKNIVFLMSKDSGENWSRPVELPAGLRRTDEFGIYPRLAVSDSGRIHLVWNVLPWPGRLVYYAHSDDDGQTWSDALLIDSSDRSAYREGYGPIVPDIQTYGGNQVHIIWDGAPTVERNHIYSLDDGETWTKPSVVFPEVTLTGRAGWNAMAFDSAGILHAVSILGPLHASFDGKGWSESQDIAVRTYTGAGEMMRIAIGLGNQIHVLWLDRNISPFAVWYVQGKADAAEIPPAAIPTPLPPAALATATPTAANPLTDTTPTVNLDGPVVDLEDYSPGGAIALATIPVFLVIGVAVAVVMRRRRAL